MQQLEDPLGSVQVTERMLAEVSQASSRRESISGKILRGQGKKHLPTMPRIQQAREPIQPGSEVIAVLRRRGGSMERHADPQGLDMHGPRLLHQPSLRIKGRSYGIRRSGKGGLHRIADHFVEPAAIPLGGRS